MTQQVNHVIPGWSVAAAAQLVGTAREVGVSRPSLLCMDVPYAPEAVAVIRHWLTDLLKERISSSVLDDVLLCASELVTNSVQHSRPIAYHDPIIVFYQTDSHSVRVDVIDSGSETRAPRMRRPRPTDLDGRGLYIVDRTADKWGSYGSPRGGAVWFEVYTPVKDPTQPD